MEILYYNDLNISPVKKQLDKVTEQLRNGDFKSADVRKMGGTPYYRARLDIENRLLFRIGEYEGKKYVFVLEVILNHEYSKSRFLRGAEVDESKLIALSDLNNIVPDDILKPSFVRENSRHFHILNKIISFDAEQDAILQSPAPFIVIGSAGSGKTALTLEKIKQLRGQILYVTLSTYLVENARNLYYSNSYENSQQELDFLSFHEYLGGIDLPAGNEINFRTFDQWISRYAQAYKIKDTYKIFEEFKGVITGFNTEKAYLDRESYLGLGIKQSVFSADERIKLYDLFEKYIEWLKEGKYYDQNIASFERLEKVLPFYDFVIVDEVQDITNIQLMLILKSLKKPQNFILCGDSNQIVHPNFFSWSNVKSLFYKSNLKAELTRILYTNYRNTKEVTAIANQLLLVKNVRFGSIDKESTYLIQSNAANQGAVEFYEDKPQTKQELNKRTGRSARYAIIVMRNEDKAEARKFFNTPLLFSVQEAKGLEYENIILYNIISQNEAEFRELCNGVSHQDLQDELKFSRSRDKADKSLEVYKFYVNSLYVAITRAVSNLYVVERARKHELLQLLGLQDFKQQVGIKAEESSSMEWQNEARKLELQGKQQQADEIRQQILKVRPVPWQVVTMKIFKDLKDKAFDPDNYNKKSKDTLYEYALMYFETWVFPKLIMLKYNKAADWKKEGVSKIERKFPEYFLSNSRGVENNIRIYGPDFRNEFNFTPLMMSALAGNSKLIDLLLEGGANNELRDNMGRQAFHIALLRAFQDPQKFGVNNLTNIYHRLQPRSVRLRFRNRLIKLETHQMEFFIFNFMVALMREITMHKIVFSKPGFETADFIRFTEHLPYKIMPDYRKKRAYLSAILSKNEVFRDDPYNKFLFLRIRTGYYILNPSLEVDTDEGFIDVYTLLQINDHYGQSHAYQKGLLNYIDKMKTQIDESRVFSNVEIGF